MVDYSTLSIVFTGLSISIAAFYYIGTLRNANRMRELTLESQELTRKAQEQALETRQAQFFMNIYNQSFANREWLKAWNKVMSTHWDDYDSYIKIADWMNPDTSDKEYLAAQGYVNSFYEGLGVFVKEGLVDIRMVALTMTYMTTRYWEKLAPIVYELRKRNNYPRMLSEFEYLYDELIKYLDEHPELKT